jgi:PAS domain S-box-containing protein
VWRGASPTPVAPADTPLARAARLQERTVDDFLEVETAQGLRKPVLASAWPLYENGRPVGAVAVHQDLSALHEADRSVRELFAIVEQTQDIVLITRRDGTIEYVNPAFEELTGYRRDEAVGQQPAILKSGEHGAGFYRDMWQVLLSGKPYAGVMASRKKNGDLYYESKTISPLRDASGRITHFVSTGKDITDSIRAETALRQHAVHQRTVALFGQRALAGGTLEELAQEAVKAVCSALNVRHSEVLMVTPDRQALALAAASAIDAALAEQVVPLTGACATALAFRANEPVVVEDYGADAAIAHPRFARSATLHSTLAMPLPGAQGPAGVLAVHASERRAFRTDERNFAQAMANALGVFVQRKAAEEQLRELNTMLEARIEERTHELADANRQLEAANEELNAFAYSVSHDLRGTLRRVQGFSNLVFDANRDKLDETSVRRLERIRSNAEHMGALVDDLLHLSRIARHKLARSHFDLSAMALSIAGALRERDAQRRADILIEPGLRAYGDQHLLRLALGNLLENAWKFTLRRECARIEVRREAAPVPTFFVRDNGAGFDARYAGKLFKPFERLHSDEDFEGSGIGLSIVQRAIAKHGGRAWGESRLGEGACFYFTLPGSEKA